MHQKDASLISPPVALSLSRHLRPRICHFFICHPVSPIQWENRATTKLAQLESMRMSVLAPACPLLCGLASHLIVVYRSSRDPSSLPFPLSPSFSFRGCRSSRGCMSKESNNALWKNQYHLPLFLFPGPRSRWCRDAGLNECGSDATHPIAWSPGTRELRRVRQASPALVVGDCCWQNIMHQLARCATISCPTVVDSSEPFRVIQHRTMPRRAGRIPGTDCDSARTGIRSRHPKQFSS
ncbi:hypothetical protein QBC43DRAFT_321941 [Cladorrhinum sp. PSN259]|nr:hypothetical protein QBC43DRAFT_321941 [Cladorrhinum sp. PSN259]